MKKILLIICALGAMALASCSRYDHEDYTGSTGTVGYTIERYLFDIVDNLVVDNLKEMERALEGSPNIWTPGTTMKVDRDNTMKGLTIRKEAADSVWSLSHNVNFPMQGNSYPTEYSMVLRMLPSQTDNYHDWEVTFSGKRTEREGYSCEFASDPKLVYNVDGSYYSWHSCFGNLRFAARKDGKMVDEIVMSLRGSKENCLIRRTF